MRITYVIGVGVALSAVGLPPSLSYAQAPADARYAPPEYIQRAAELPESMATGAERRLSVTDALALAVRHNLGIVLNQSAVDAARQAVATSRGQFEPTVTGTYGHQSATSPPLDTDQGEEAFRFLNDSLAVGVSQVLRSGTVLSVDFNNVRSDSEADNAVAPVSYRADVTASVTQPLLRGFSLDLAVPRASILRAELDTELAEHTVMVTMLDTVQQTEDAYWDLVQALKDYQVQDGSLRLAEEQLDLTRRQIAAGILAPAELISVEGTLAQRQLDMVQAESAIASASDQLRQVLNLPREQWAAPILPTDAPGFTPVSPDEDQVFEQALARRPEIRRSEINHKRAELDLRVARNQRLPQLDLRVSGGIAGQDRTYKNALDRLASREAPTWGVFLNLSWTPLGRASRARLESLRSTRKVAQLQIDQRVLALRVQVRQAIRSLDTAARQVKAAAKFRALAERSLDAEQRKFINGTSSNFFVAQRQEQLAQARQSELAAVIAHRKATTNLERVAGSLLDKRQIEVTVRAPARAATRR